MTKTTIIALMLFTTPLWAQERSPVEDLISIIRSEEFRKEVYCDTPTVKQARDLEQLRDTAYELCMDVQPRRGGGSLIETITAGLQKIDMTLQMHDRRITVLEGRTPTQPTYQPTRVTPPAPVNVGAGQPSTPQRAPQRRPQVRPYDDRRDPGEGVRSSVPVEEKFDPIRDWYKIPSTQGKK